MRKDARPSPYTLGQMAARSPGSLKGLPFGPGRRQDEFIRGFEDERLEISHADALDRAAKR